MQKQYEKHVWETSNDTYSLSVRVQTTINHISICFFLPQYQRQRKCFSSERELKKALRDTLGTLSIEDGGCHGRSPEVIFHVSSYVAMDTPSVPDERSRRQRRIA